MKGFTYGLLAAMSVGGLSTAANAAVVFDNFNAGEGHFSSLVVGGSGSTNGFATSSSADHTTADKFEGAGSQIIVLNDDATAGGTSRLRHLSGAGSAGNNTSFATSAGTDGWIGFYVKTTAPGWNVQVWIEGPENNGSTQTNLIADGAWHLYEWDLDDQDGGATGWQATGVPGIVAGDVDVQNGTYTIDSILFRNNATPASSTIYLDFVAKSDSGSIAALVPEPTSMALLGVVGAGLLGRRRRI